MSDPWTSSSGGVTMMAMRVLVGVMAVVLAGCAEPVDRVRLISSPADDPTFVTRCRHTEQCIAGARAVCPSGYVKVSLEGDVKERELTFKCHGKADWP